MKIKVKKSVKDTGSLKAASGTQKKKPAKKRPAVFHPDRAGQFWNLWIAVSRMTADEKRFSDPQREFQFHETRRWRFDFAWPYFKLAVEIEGGFSSSKSGHRSVAGFLKDIEKYNEAASAGWCVLRFTAKDLDEKPMQTVQFVRDAIIARSS